MQIINKTSQAWGLDAMVAFIIFIASIIFFFFYIINFNDDAGNNIDSLQEEGNSILRILLTEGYPYNWDVQNVISPGVISEERVNSTKVYYLYQISLINYTRLKTLLNTRKDFYIYFDFPLNASGNLIGGFGKTGINETNIFQNENPDNLVKVERATIYENKPGKFNLYVWD